MSEGYRNFLGMTVNIDGREMSTTKLCSEMLLRKFA